MRRKDGAWEKFDDYVIDFVLDRLRAAERVALVTLVKIEGSSPRPLGAQMAVSGSGEWVGYLSGGCLERAVVAEAQAAMEDGRNRRVRYGRGSKYLDIQLPCGSAIELVFDVNVAEHELRVVDAKLGLRQSALIRIPAHGYPDEVLIRQYHPRRRLIVAGVGPATVHLAKLGRMAGFETMLHSPDDATMQTSEADDISTFAMKTTNAIPNFQADARSAIVFMFHDHEWERSLIPAALETDAFYIGAMGSRRTHRQRLEMLAKLGVDPVRTGRIRGPAGLFSGAKSAPDIAMSILAEIMQVERGTNVPNMIFDDLSLCVDQTLEAHR